MSIESSAFGCVRLSGKDADRFRHEVKIAKPNPKAQQSLDRGRKLLSKMKDGKISLGKA